MSSFVQELQRDAMDSKKSISDLLRKALVASRKLVLKEFETWISAELNGYSEGQEFPSYRIIKGEVVVWNPYHGYIPLMFQDSKEADACSKRAIGQPVGQIESLLSDEVKSQSCHVPFPADIEAALMKGMDPPLRPTLKVGKPQVQGILDAVRNSILNWSLKLEEDGITGEGMSFSDDDKKKAAHHTTIEIQNFQGILGDVQNSHVHQEMSMEINKSDLKSLTTYFESLGIPKEDVREVEDALKSETVPKEKGKFGSKVGAWLGKMTTKAATGAWKVGVDVGSSLLVKAVSKYYGLE